MTDFKRLFRDELDKRLEALDVHDVIALVQHIPKIVQWFRSRGYDTVAIERDLASFKTVVGTAADAARAELRHRFDENQSTVPGGIEER